MPREGPRKWTSTKHVSATPSQPKPECRIPGWEQYAAQANRYLQHHITPRSGPLVVVVAEYRMDFEYWVRHMAPVRAPGPRTAKPIIGHRQEHLLRGLGRDTPIFVLRRAPRLDSMGVWRSQHSHEFHNMIVTHLNPMFTNITEETLP